MASQSSAFDSLSSARASEPPPELSHAGKRWRAIEHAPNKRRNAKQGRAWSLGQEYELIGDNRVRAWRCNLCPNDAVILLSHKQINPANRHLEAKHAQVWGSTKDEDVENDEEVSGLI